MSQYFSRGVNLHTNAAFWVNFNGTGTPAIRNSYNVSSITDNGTGDFTLNFSNPLSSANYNINSYSAVSNSSVASVNVRGIGNCVKASGSLRIQAIYYSATNGAASVDDHEEVNVAGFI